MNQMMEKVEQQTQSLEEKQLTLEELTQVTGGTVVSLAGIKLAGEYKRGGFEAGADYER